MKLRNPFMNATAMLALIAMAIGASGARADQNDELLIAHPQIIKACGTYQVTRGGPLALGAYHGWIHFNNQPRAFAHSVVLLDATPAPGFDANNTSAEAPAASGIRSSVRALYGVAAQRNGKTKIVCREVDGYIASAGVRNGKWIINRFKIQIGKRRWVEYDVVPFVMDALGYAELEVTPDRQSRKVLGHGRVKKL